MLEKGFEGSQFSFIRTPRDEGEPKHTQTGAHQHVRRVHKQLPIWDPGALELSKGGCTLWPLNAAMRSGKTGLSPHLFLSVAL